DLHRGRYQRAYVRTGFFFFQAEDGIRDFHVTGVQTCALPIWSSCEREVANNVEELVACRFIFITQFDVVENAFLLDGNLWLAKRSEERRVGKECRARCPPYRRKENWQTWRSARDVAAEAQQSE